MALIPVDAALRLRMDTDAALQPLRPVREISSDLPELHPGQGFTARIQEELPDNLYRALVAGKALTLQLPEGAKSGDLLELVVVDRSPQVLIARRVETAAASGAGEPYPYATLSRTAQMIGQLLLPQDEALQPALLNRGQPLMPLPPADDGTPEGLAGTLAKAVRQSGLFYEAHQAQWVAGKLPIEQLLQEPQGRQASSQAASSGQSPVSSPPATPSLLQTLFGIGENPAEAPAGIRNDSLAQAVPDTLRPLVQQQLDAVATQRLVWQGEIWPGQTMQWEIEQEDLQDRNTTPEEAIERWSTTLRLTLPRLGQVDATLQLAGGGVRVRLSTADGGTAADLRDEAPRLAQALTAAGLPLAGFEVKPQ